ncbi:hypothetical protein N7931_06550 [Catenovulum sp. 2E275]|uniref:Slam-dependent surface lipoprotein n=1 Tax=Catenovulum sp. 2E275 TaxID=2980497 RepID=UPI0021CEA241|nr:Slam-dependent surface lipoprotein [Catenovulum sp. 2E275]MCU4675291.1 hypothetical protein [Catenovulum sp. 2E275]
MKQFNLALLVTATFVASTAQAAVTEGNYYGDTSDGSYVSVGKSDVNAGTVHTAGLAGFGVNATGIGTQVDFQGISGYSTSSYANVDWGTHEVFQFSAPYSGAPSSHGNMGVFAFAKIGSDDLWIGEWSSNGDVTNGSHTVYYFGKDYDSSIPSSGSVTYNVVGINDYSSASGGNLLSGEFEATFNGSYGTLTGSIENSNGFKIDIGTAAISSTAIISGSTAEASDSSGSLASNGDVSGRFYNSHEDLAGMVEFTNNQYDTAFGGSVAD